MDLREELPSVVDVAVGGKSAEANDLAETKGNGGDGHRVSEQARVDLAEDPHAATFSNQQSNSLFFLQLFFLLLPLKFLFELYHQ